VTAGGGDAACVCGVEEESPSAPKPWSPTAGSDGGAGTAAVRAGETVDRRSCGFVRAAVRRWCPELPAAATPAKTPVSTAAATPSFFVSDRSRCIPALRECIRARRCRVFGMPTVQQRQMKIR